jgi:hypothetical protein
MNDFYFDLLSDDGRCCGKCSHFYKLMKKADVFSIEAANPEAGKYKEGQKFCLKRKYFVYFYECCTDFTKNQ